MGPISEASDKIPAINRREIFMRTCELMYSHYNILNIVDLKTALKIIEGTLDWRSIQKVNKTQSDERDQQDLFKDGEFEEFTKGA